MLATARRPALGTRRGPPTVGPAPGHQAPPTSCRDADGGFVLTDFGVSQASRLGRGIAAVRCRHAGLSGARTARRTFRPVRPPHRPLGSGRHGLGDGDGHPSRRARGTRARRGRRGLRAAGPVRSLPRLLSRAGARRHEHAARRPAEPARERRRSAGEHPRAHGSLAGVRSSVAAATGATSTTPRSRVWSIPSSIRSCSRSAAARLPFLLREVRGRGAALSRGRALGLLVPAAARDRAGHAGGSGDHPRGAAGVIPRRGRHALEPLLYLDAHRLRYRVGRGPERRRTRTVPDQQPGDGAAHDPLDGLPPVASATARGRPGPRSRLPSWDRCAARSSAVVADVGERSLRAPRERFLHAPGERFLLAPMSGLIRGLTCLALGVPGALVLGGFATPAPASTVLLGTAIFVVAIYGFVWGWLRPREFLVDAEALVIAFPWRERRIPRDSSAPPGRSPRRSSTRPTGSASGWAQAASGEASASSRRGADGWTCTSRVTTASCSWSGAAARRCSCRPSPHTHSSPAWALPTRREPAAADARIPHE